MLLDLKKNKHAFMRKQSMIPNEYMVVEETQS